MRTFLLSLTIAAALPTTLLAQGPNHWVKVQKRYSDVHQQAEMSFFVLYARVEAGDTRINILRSWMPAGTNFEEEARRLRGRNPDPNRIEVGEILVMFVYPWEMNTWDIETINFWRDFCTNKDRFDEVLEAAEYYAWLRDEEKS